MTDEKWEDNVMMTANKEAYISAEDVIEYKNAIKALYYLLSIKKSK